MKRIIPVALGLALALGAAGCGPSGPSTPTPDPNSPTPTAPGPTPTPNTGISPTTPPPAGLKWVHNDRYGFTAAVPTDWNVEQVTEPDGSGVTAEQGPDTSMKALASDNAGADPATVCDAKAALYKGTGINVREAGNTDKGCYFVGVTQNATVVQWQMWYGREATNMFVATYPVTQEPTLGPKVTAARKAFVPGTLDQRH